MYSVSFGTQLIITIKIEIHCSSIKLFPIILLNIYIQHLINIPYFICPLGLFFLSLLHCIMGLIFLQRIQCMWCCPIIWLKEDILGAIQTGDSRSWDVFWKLNLSTAVFEMSCHLGDTSATVKHIHLVHIYIEKQWKSIAKEWNNAFCVNNALCVPFRRQRKWVAYFLEQTLRLLMP